MNIIARITNFIASRVFIYRLKKEFSKHPELAGIVNGISIRSYNPGKERKTRFYKVLTGSLEILEAEFENDKITENEVLDRLELLKDVNLEHYTELLDKDFDKDDKAGRSGEISDFCMKVTEIMLKTKKYNKCTDYKIFLSEIDNMPEIKNEREVTWYTQEEIDALLG